MTKNESATTLLKDTTNNPSVIDWTADEVFDIFDADNSNDLDIDELIPALTATLAKKITREETEKILRLYDTNDDYRLDRKEFVSLVTAMRSQMKTTKAKLARIKVSKKDNKTATAEARALGLRKKQECENYKAKLDSVKLEEDGEKGWINSLLQNEYLVKADIHDDVRSLVDSLSEAEIRLMKEVAELGVEELSNPVDHLRLIVDLYKNRISRAAKNKIKNLEIVGKSQSMKEKRETLTKVKAAMSCLDNTNEKYLLGLGETALQIVVKLKLVERDKEVKGEGREKDDRSDDYFIDRLLAVESLATEMFVRSAIEIAKNIPESTFTGLIAASENSDDQKTTMTTVVKIVLSLDTQLISDILYSAIRMGVALAPYAKRHEHAHDHGNDDETSSSGAERNQLIVIIKHAAPYVSSLFMKLMSLPEEFKDKIISILPDNVRKACTPVIEMAEGMVETDVEELFVMLAMESLPKEVSKKDSAVDVVMRLDTSHEEVLEGGEEKRKDFEESFKKDIAKALGIDAGRIQIQGFKQGSVIVEFTIDTSASENEPSTSDVVERLQTQLRDTGSQLFQGTVTNTALNELEVKFQEPEPETEEEKTTRMKKENAEMRAKVFKAMKLVARTETRRLARWVRDSPTSLRVLGFLCGVATFFSGCFSFVFDLFSGQFSAFLLSFWLFVFGLLIVLVEAKISAFQAHALPVIEKYFQFLGIVEGRGFFLIFVGLMGCSLITKGSWQNFFTFISGICSILVGLLFIVQGKRAEGNLRLLRGKFTDEEFVRKTFHDCDVNNNGSLDLSELEQLCVRLGSLLTGQQLELVLMQLDKNKDGSVDVEEFVAWWRGGGGEKGEDSGEEKDISDIEEGGGCAKEVVDSVRQMKEGISESKRTPTAIRIMNLSLGFGLVLGSVVGLVATLSNHAESFVVAILDVWCVFFGFLMVFVEGSGGSDFTWGWKDGQRFARMVNKSERAGGSFRAKLYSKYARFLDTVVGRGVFYFFIAMLAISTYEKKIGTEGILSVLVGIGILISAILNIIAGMRANSTLKSLQSKITKDQIEREFRAADVDGSGELSLDELAQFVGKMNIEMSHRSWELLVESMDRDGSGGISLEEFNNWFSREMI